MPEKAPIMEGLRSPVLEYEVCAGEGIAVGVPVEVLECRRSRPQWRGYVVRCWNRKCVLVKHWQW